MTRYLVVVASQDGNAICTRDGSGDVNATCTLIESWLPWHLQPQMAAQVTLATMAETTTAHEQREACRHETVRPMERAQALVPPPTVVSVARRRDDRGHRAGTLFARSRPATRSTDRARAPTLTAGHRPRSLVGALPTRARTHTGPVHIRARFCQLWEHSNFFLCPVLSPLAHSVTHSILSLPGPPVTLSSLEHAPPLLQHT